MDSKKTLEEIFLFCYNKMMSDLRGEFLDQIRFYNTFQKHTIPVNDAKEFFSDRISKEVDTQKVKPPIISKFILENTGEIGFKNKTAYHVVRAYIKDHPKTSLKDLREVFERPDLKLKRLFKELKEIKEEEKKQPRRFFYKEDELFKTGDGKTFALTTQWGDNFDDLVKIANRLGYRIVQLKEVNK
jgi:hypothetical protein